MADGTTNNWQMYFPSAICPFISYMNYIMPTAFYIFDNHRFHLIFWLLVMSHWFWLFGL